MPSRPLDEAEVPPVPVAGVDKSCWRLFGSDEYSTKASITCIALDELPIGEKVIGFRWVSSRKHGNNGTIVKTKATRAARGFIPREGIDFCRIAAPQLAASELRYPVYYLDTAQVFTQAELDRTLYMKLR